MDIAKLSRKTEMKLNCLIIDVENDSRKYLEFYTRHSDMLNLCGTCSSLAQAENIYSRESIDLTFLDIELPGNNGLEILYENKIKSMIILVTTKEKYAVQAFEYDVIDYLLKPFSYLRFEKAVERAKRAFELSSRRYADETIMIKSSSYLFRIRVSDIIYIEAKGDYMQIVTRDKKYHTYGTMCEMFNRLPANKFSRVHRSFIINKAFVNQIYENHLVVDSISIPIGVSYRKNLIITSQVS